MSHRQPASRIGPAALAGIEDLFQLAPVALCVVDREFRYVRANDHYAAAVGYTPADLVGRTMREVIPASAREGALAVASRVMETGEPVLDIELHREVPEEPAGERYWRVNVHPLKRDGIVIGAMAALLNITSVRQAQQLADQRREELESIYRNAPIGLTYVDRDLRYLRVNQAIADMNGVSIEEMIGKTYRDLSPETADLAEPFLRKVMERGQPLRNLEVRARPPSDRQREHVYLLGLEPVRNAAGEVRGHVAAVHDVTELREAQEAARLRLAELEILYEHSPVALCHLDPELRVLHMSPRFAGLTGRSAEEARGADLTTLLARPILARLVPHLRHVLRKRAPSVDLEIRGRAPGESGLEEYTWLARSYPTLSQDSEVTGVITVLQDVTSLAERRREVEAVRDRLTEAQRVAGFGSWEWDVLQDRVWWSPGLYGLFGEPPTYAPSYTGFLDHVHPADHGKLRDQLEGTLAHGEPYRVIFRIERPDGGQRRLLAIAGLERTPDGHPARLVGSCQDVTDLGDFDAMVGPVAAAGRRRR